MESLVLNRQSKNQIIEHRDNSCHIKYEYGIIGEMLTAIEQNDQETLNWFGGFGDSLRAIIMNVYAYRKGLEFGFTDIAFSQYGWFMHPVWLDKEDLTFGDTSRYGNYSTIYLGRGANNIWTYAMDCSFGTAGSGYHLSVYGKQFKNREASLVFALAELKNLMTEKIGNSDTTNYKQPVILGTLKDISKAEIGMVQLTLF